MKPNLFLFPKPNYAQNNCRLCPNNLEIDLLVICVLFGIEWKGEIVVEVYSLTFVHSKLSKIETILS